MGYLTVKQFSEKWGITERRIINLCRENRITGAVKNGMVWMIPEDTIKPSDKRNKVSKYIHTQKRISLINSENEIGKCLIPLLEKDGYIVDKNKDSKEKYYDGLILIDLNHEKNNEAIIREFAKRMNCESSIVLVNKISNSEEHLEIKLSKELKESIGIRINAINLDFPKTNNVFINYQEIAEDIMSFLTGFKNTSGMSITTDGGCIEFDKNGKTRNLNVGDFYRIITGYFKRLNKESYMWCASTMLEDEWTEEPLEMNFRVQNLDAANRGANLERIFIFSKSKIKEFKNNNTLKIYMQSNIKTLFVDYDELKEKHPELLKIVANGWDGIDDTTLLIDLPEGESDRGYISINKDEVQKAYKCFKELKKYAKDLKDVLK